MVLHEWVDEPSFAEYLSSDVFARSGAVLRPLVTAPPVSRRFRAELLKTAHEPIQVAIPQPVTTSSVLFDPGFAPQPPAALTVFDLSPLARALVSKCVAWPDAAEPLPPYARSVFGALVAVAWRLAQNPRPVGSRTRPG